MPRFAERKSILEMARGAILEKVDVEMDRVVKNILDPNTNPQKKRSIRDWLADKLKAEIDAGLVVVTV